MLLMNPRKRDASELLPTTRSSKVPRTARDRYPGADTPNSDGILSKWDSLRQDFMALAAETINHFVRGQPAPPDMGDEPRAQPPFASSSAPSRLHSGTTPSRPPIPAPFLGDMGPPPPRAAPQPSTAPTSRRNSTTLSSTTGGTSPPSSRLTSVSTSLSTMSPYPEINAALAASQRREQEKTTRARPGREHIYAKRHKTRTHEDRVKDRENMMKELFHLKRSSGYASDFNAFQSLLGYQQRLELMERRDILSPSPSLEDFRSITSGSPRLNRTRSLSELPFADDVKPDFLERALKNARETMNGPKPPKPFVPSFDQLRLSARAKDDAIEQRLRPKRRPLPTSLPPEDEALVTSLLSRRGVVSKFAKEQVSGEDIQRLQPASWLNDEIINFYGAMLLARAEGSKENPAEEPGANGRANGKAKGVGASGRGKPLNAHYFNSFFWSKLRNEGYEKARLAKWTKKIDIFAKDIVLIPVNHNNSHWTAAAINFRRKRIESYDSMNMDRSTVYKALRGYLDAEHRNKKKKPFDFTGWEDYSLADTPQQENGYDCGVFTCQFLETLSRGEDSFGFQQTDMPYLRRRMIWELGNAQLRDE